MDKGLFANDGSFMERFKQMQQEKDKEKAPATGASPSATAPKAVNPKTPIVIPMNKRPLEVKKAAPILSGGKLAFSLKKNKAPILPVKFGAEEEDDEDDVAGAKREDHAKRHKSADAPSAAAPAGVVASAPPNDMTVRQVADKLASFVAKNGRQFEDITRQRNPGDTPFKFLFDKNCSDYKYYETRLAEEEKMLAQTKDASQASKIVNSSTVSSRAHSGSQRSSYENKSNYQTPASALYGAYEGSSSQGSSSSHGDSMSAPPSDPVALMEFYMKKAAQEERKRPPRQSKDEMPPPPCLIQGPPKKGHHMGDFIPQEELEKFMARCNDAAAQKATKESKSKWIKEERNYTVAPVLGTMDEERAYGLLGTRKQDGRAMEGMLLNQTVVVAATNPEEDDTRGDTKFNASQYAFFGNNVMEEVELGGLEDDDGCGDADFVGLGDEGYSSIHGSDMLEDEGVGSFTAVDDLAGTFSKLTRIVNEPKHRGIVGHVESVSRQSSSTADWTQQEPESSYWPKQHALDAEHGLDNNKWSSHLAQFSDTRLHRASSSPHQDAQYNPTEHILGPRPFYLHRMSSYPQQDTQYNHTETIHVPKSPFIPYPPSSVSHSSSGGPHLMNIPSPPTAFHMPASAQNELPFSHPHNGGTPPGPLFGRNLVQMGSPGLSTNIMQQNHGLNSGPVHGNGARITPALMEHPNGLITPQMQPPHQQHGIRPIQQSSPQFSQLNPHMLGPRHSSPQNLQMFGPQHPPSQTRGRFDANFGMPDLSDPRARSMLYHGRQGQFLPPQGFELGSMRMDNGWPRFRSKYMSTEEIENIARVQQAATHSNDPYIDDYYHQACLATKSAGAHLRHHFCPTLIRDPSARASSKDEPHAYLQVDALGRLPFSSIRRPRPLLDVEEASTPSDSIPEKTASKTLDQEPMLAARITIEDGLCHLLDVDDINRLLQFSQQQDGGLELTNRRQALLKQLAESLQLVDPLGPSKSVPLSPNDDLVFLRVISLSKGRKLLSRYLELVTPISELARIACMAVFRHLRFIFGNLPSDSSAAASTTKLASAISTCIRQMELSGLSACLAATVCSSLQPPLRPLGYAAGDGASVIIMSVLDRATELLTDQHVSSTYSMQNRGLWQASFDAFFRLLTEYCMSKFDNLVHTAQMQPSAAAAISREIPVELLRASLPHTNEHQRKQLLNFAQRTVPFSSARSSHESGDRHTASGGPKLS